MNVLEKYQANLSRNARLIAEAVGFDTLERLVAAFGGLRVPVNKGKRAHGMENRRRLLSVVSHDDIERLIPLTREGQLYVPTCKDAYRAAREAAFLADYEQLRTDGESQRFILMALCGRHGISYPLARRIVIAHNGSANDDTY